jgi:hypothetical protein
MIIGLSGYARSGKDTVAQILIDQYGYERVAFADALRTFVYDANPIVSSVGNELINLKTVVDRDGWDESKKISGVRQILQTAGLAARMSFGEDFWVNRALDKVSYTGNYVITDVRFKNEALNIQRRDYAQVWRVTRPGVGPVNNHVSEHDLDDWTFDYQFINSGNLEDLELSVKTRMQNLQ